VQRVESPPGEEDSLWHRYVITQGGNTIEGRRQGSLQAVTSAVEQIVEQLNQRRVGGSRRVHLVMNSSKKTTNSH
jgi:hypothetical protein